MKETICVAFMIFGFAELITAQISTAACVTPNNEKGVCISIKKCQELNDLLENRRHITSVKILLQKSFCGYDGINPKVCCPLEKESSQGGQGGQGANIPTANLNPTANINPSSQLLLSNKACGKVMNNDNDDRIVGGRESKLDAWPWMTAIGYKRPERRSPIHWGCGGSLISDQHVLTAAHCLVNLGSIKPHVARLGDLDLNPNVYDGASPIDVLIESFITHENYLENKKTVNDIAIIKLKDRVTFNNHIQPICLPSPMDANINYKKVPIVSGWGSTNPSQIFDRIHLNTKLMEIELPLIHDNKCKLLYADQRSSLIDNRVLCAGYLEGKKDSCRGDSGGPLMLAKQLQYHVMGIVSYGPSECGIPNKPGVYTRVSSFTNWILAKIAQM